MNRGRQTQIPVKNNRDNTNLNEKCCVYFGLFVIHFLEYVLIFYSFHIQPLFSCEVIAVFNYSTIFCSSSRLIEGGKPEAPIIGNGFGLCAIRKSGHINRIKGGKVAASHSTTIDRAVACYAPSPVLTERNTLTVRRHFHASRV